MASCSRVFSGFKSHTIGYVSERIPVPFPHQQGCRNSEGLFWLMTMYVVKLHKWRPACSEKPPLVDGWALLPRVTLATLDWGSHAQLFWFHHAF